jgi:hypothetical protein
MPACKTFPYPPSWTVAAFTHSSRVWQEVSMDFIKGLPKSEGYTVIMVIVDRLNKYAHFIPVKHPYTASSIAQLFLDNIVKLHGMPQSIVLDRDTIFVSFF